MRVLLFLWILLLLGCRDSHKQTEPPLVVHRTLLDEALGRPEFTEAIKQAEQELPDDEWRESRGSLPRWNISRHEREYAVTTNILATVVPKFSQMSVTELVRSLKVFTPVGGTYESFGGVASFVYQVGNEELIKQIQSRPKVELRVLPGLADNRVHVYTGPQGPPDTLDSLIHWRILKDR